MHKAAEKVQHAVAVQTGQMQSPWAGEDEAGQPRRRKQAHADRPMFGPAQRIRSAYIATCLICG